MAVGLAAMGLGVMKLAHLEDRRDHPSLRALDPVVDDSEICVSASRSFHAALPTVQP